MTAKILDALKKLDPTNDNHWTEDGSPRMDTMKFLSGDPSLTREAVTAAAPGFSRASPQEPVVIADPVSKQQGDGDESVEGSAGEGQADSEAKPRDEEASPAARLEAAQAALVKASARKAEANKAHAEASQEVDRCIDAITQGGGSETFQDQLSAYHAQQRAMLEERARKINAMKGIDLKSFLPSRAPIDQALARKNTRGTQRPGVLK